MVDVGEDAVVVLDVDDTLYLERDYVKSGFDAVSAHLRSGRGVEGFGDTLWSGFLEGVRGDAFDRGLAAHGLEPDPALIAELVSCYRSHRPVIELLPDAGRFLSRLAGRRTAVITDGPARCQRAKVEVLGLVGRVDPLVLTDELGPGLSKPDPAAYSYVEQHLDVPPELCIYIGDNPAKDFVSPLARGWTSIRIRRPGSLHHGHATVAGAQEIESLDELAT